MLTSRAAHQDVNVAIIKKRELRADQSTISTWLDRLDQYCRPPSELDMRVSERFSYRLGTLRLELPEDLDKTTHQAVVARNISREGVGLLSSHFVYPRAACQVLLRSPYGCDQVVPGRVARCRYLVGSTSLYEVGVRFDRPVDVPLFAPHGKLVSILLVDDAETTQRLLASFLGRLNVELSHAATAGQAFRLSGQCDFDLVLIDLENDAFDPIAVARYLRGDGFVGPIIGLTIQIGDDLDSVCHKTGFTGYIGKPLTRDAMRDLVGTLTDPPVVSTLMHDDALAPLIDEFVKTLRDRVSEMAVAFQDRDADALEQIVYALRGVAGSYGFDDITTASALVQALLAAGDSWSIVRPPLLRLMHLCLKARPATSPPAMAPRAVSAWPALALD